MTLFLFPGRDVGFSRIRRVRRRPVKGRAFAAEVDPRASPVPRPPLKGTGSVVESAIQPSGQNEILIPADP
jgi:hypothetical protein